MSDIRKRALLATEYFLAIMLLIEVLFRLFINEAGYYFAWIPIIMVSLVNLWLLALLLTGWLNISLFKLLGLKEPPPDKFFP